jgi:branched-chain amino acid transport system permease protein
VNSVAQPRARSRSHARAGGVAAVLVVAALLAFPQVISSDQFVTAAITALLAIFMAQCWNLAAGYAGLFSLGHAVFLGIGAYTSTLLFTKAGISPWLGVFAGAGLAAVVGAALALVAFLYRIRGTSFAILTLGAMEVAKGLADNWDWISGPLGINLVLMNEPANMLFMSRTPYYYIILGCVLAITALTWRMEHSRFGQYLLAIREDEDAAEASGIDVRRCKILVMALSAGLTALAGTFYAQFYLYVSPDTLFVFDHQLTMMLGAMVGGAGTILGPIVGSSLFSAIAEVLRNLPFDETRYINSAAKMFYAVVLMAVMIYLPGGVLSAVSARMRRNERAEQ